MKFPRYKAKYFDKKIDLAFKFCHPLIEKLMNESMKGKTSDEDFKKCRDLIIETSFLYADRFIKKASEK